MRPRPVSEGQLALLLDGQKRRARQKRRVFEIHSVAGVSRPFDGTRRWENSVLMREPRVEDDA